MKMRLEGERRKLCHMALGARDSSNLLRPTGIWLSGLALKRSVVGSPIKLASCL